ncbi:hypothetical protein RIF29_30066 [Crotalaria pallida]|uniref:Uncharacterized protein n=1 Tax=Crotalaria pallida TaxID=3830 RepID=A0AAN9HWF7_CROPI
MAKKRGRPPKTPTNQPSPLSASTQKEVSGPSKNNVFANPLNLDMLEEQETEFHDLFDSLDSMNEQQVKALLENMDRIHEKIKGKHPMNEETIGSENPKQDGPNTTNPTKVQEQIKEGLISAERVNVDELRPIVVESANGQEGKDSVVVSEKSGTETANQKHMADDQWHTVTTRRKLMQQKKLDSEIGRGSPSHPANG